MKRLLLVMFALLVLLGCDEHTSTKVISTVNRTVESDLSKYGEITNIVATLPREFISVYNTGGSGIFLFLSDCDYCDIAATLVDKAASELGVLVYCIDVDSDEYPFVEFYDEILTILYDEMPEDESGKKTIYTPLLVTIENGQIKNSHLGLLDHEYDSEKDDDELILTYKEVMSAFGG